MANLLQGVLPILQTPFDEQDELDVASLRREVEWAYELGVAGIGTGMVSEVLRLTRDERRRLGELIVETTAGRGVTFLSVGAESTRQACEFARDAEQIGCDAIMAVPPLHTRLPAAAMLGYFDALARAVSLPLIVQDASGYVGQSIPLEVCLQLLDRWGAERIVFKPEAAPLGPNLSALRDASGGQARIFEGSGGIGLIDSYRRGIAGTMPGMDLVDGVLLLWQALEADDDPAAYTLYFPLAAMIGLQLQAGLDGFLAIEKYLLVRRGIFASDRRRTPYGWSLDEETRAEVDRLFAIFQCTVESYTATE